MTQLSPEKKWNRISVFKSPAVEVWKSIATQLCVESPLNKGFSQKVELAKKNVHLTVVNSDYPRLLQILLEFGDNSVRLDYLLTEVGTQTQLDQSASLLLRCLNNTAALLAKHLKEDIVVCHKTRDTRFEVSSDFPGGLSGMNPFARTRLAWIGITEGENFERWQDHWRQNPGKRFWEDLRTVEYLYGYRNRYLPELLKLRQECEKRFPYTDSATITEDYRAQIDLLRNKMQEYSETEKRSKPGLFPEMITLATTSKDHFQAAIDVFGKREDFILFFEDKDIDPLGTVLPAQWGNDEGPEIFKTCTWNLQEIDSAGAETYRSRFNNSFDRLAPPTGARCWVYTFSEIKGPTNGHGYSELWSWDGRQSTFIESVDTWIA